ncbi:MAG: NAD-dependent epimerase/dehydratase family protein [Armatimonadetes bacterium]|nr:NAD-dependent epimerase/dehydratase family protein [Armatimonadota bacterium]
MAVLVTGGTGFIGSHIVRALIERGERPRCLVRRDSRLENLAGLPVERIEGDLTDPASLARAVRGADQVFHAAADYRLWSRDPAQLYCVNVAGTRALLRAAAEAGAKRIVYTSSVGALGIPADGSPGTEETPVALADMVGHYKRSKFLAEQEALRLAAQGAPVVIVNPSTPVGPGDIKPTPTGQIIVDFLRGRMPAYVDTGLNLVAVEDVAVGHLLAAERGRVGEKYILGCRNLTLRETLEILATVTSLPAPRVRIPYHVAWMVGALDTLINGTLRGRPPRAPLEGVRMARKKMFFSAEKAVRELGLPQSPVEQALARAVAWFREHGYERDTAPEPPEARVKQGAGGGKGRL